MANKIKLPPVPQSQLMATSTQAIWRDWYNKLMRAFSAKIDTITGAAGYIAMFDDQGNIESSGKKPPDGDIVGTSDTQTLSNKTLVEPAIDDFTLAQHDHTTAKKGGNVVEASLNLSDVTTNNASATKHGFMPRLSGDASKFFNGQGQT